MNTTEHDLTCGKCKTPLEINSAHVIFKGEKTAYIKCSNPKCNNTRRIAYDTVEHLKPAVEAVKPVKQEETENKAGQSELTESKIKEPEINAAEHELTDIVIKYPLKSSSVEPEQVKQESTKNKAEQHDLTESKIKEPEINAAEEETDGGMIWGAVAAVIVLIASIVGMIWLSWRNRKEEV